MKKKNLFLSMLAIASMLFATSCSQDELQNGPSADDYVNAKFTIETPEGIETRSRAEIGDGTTVNYVACAVYDENEAEMPALRQYIPISNKTAEYSIRLVKGQSYRIAFFAYKGDENGGSEYYNLADMKNITISTASSNIESRDAFTNYIDITAQESMNAIEKPVTLYRPFAQLNLGAYKDDIEAAEKAGVVVTQSQIKVSNVYTTFSAFDDAVVGETSEVTFALNRIPVPDLYIDLNNDDVKNNDEYFDYLALNYLLVGDKDSEKSLTDVEFVWKTEDGKTNNPTTVFKNIPVQRNYRTNIIGYLLTNPAVFNITIDAEFEKPDYIVNGNPDQQYLLNTIEEAVKNGQKNIVVDAQNNNIGALNYKLTKTLIPEGTTVTLRNAIVEGKSYGNGVDGKIIFENCTFTNTGAYSIHFDNGAGEVEFKNCVLYGWNSFGSSLKSVSFYDSRLYGNGTYALIRSYVNLYVENCYFNTINANHNDIYNEGVEVVGEATKTEVNCFYADNTETIENTLLTNGTVELTEDIAVSANSNIHTYTTTKDLTIDGKGKTIVSYAESAADFQWSNNRTIPAMSTILSSSTSQRTRITVNDLNFEGTISALMLGHYYASNSNNNDIFLNNVNVINTKVVSFSANVAPAVCVYGTATLEDCNIYGTTRSELETSPMWELCDIAVVNDAVLTLKGGKIGKIIAWAKSKITVENDAVVESIKPVYKSMNTNEKYGVTVKAGGTVEVLDLSNIDLAAKKINITIEEGATIGKIIDANGNEYSTLEAFKNAQ